MNTHTKANYYTEDDVVEPSEECEGQKKVSNVLNLLQIKEH